MPSCLIALELPQFVTKEMLKRIFDPDDTIIYNDKIIIKSYQNPKSDKKFAIIEFKLIHQATSIINDFHNTTHEGILLNLYLSSELIFDLIKRDQKTLFIEIKPDKISAEQIIEIFKEYGNIKDYKFLKNKSYFSVTFSYIEEVIAAHYKYENGSNENILYTLISPYALHKKGNNQGMKTFFKNSSIKLYDKKNYSESSIFVFNIPMHSSPSGQMNELSIDERFLRDLFRDYEIIPGGIIFGERVNLMDSKYYYAIVYFASRNDALKAIKELNYTYLDGLPIRLVLADKETRNILKTNKGKIMVKNLDEDIVESQLDDAFSNFGPVVEVELMREGKRSLGVCYVHFKNQEDANQALIDLRDASINGRVTEMSPLEEAKITDPDKQYLYTEIKKIKKKNTFNFNVSIEKVSNSFHLLNQLKFTKNFVFLFDKKKLTINKKVLELLSPKIQNNPELSSLRIESDSFFSNFSYFDDLLPFIFAFQQNLSKKQLKKKLFETFENFLNIIKNGELDKFIEIIEKSCEFFNQGQNQLGLDFIILIQMFLHVFGNKILAEKFVDLFLKATKEKILKTKVPNEESLILRIGLKDIMNDHHLKVDYVDEINYVVDKFYDIERSILNQISERFIEMVITDILFDSKSEDLFLYKILTLKEDLVHCLIHFVDFVKISNEAMKFFLDSFKLSDFDEGLLASVSERFSLALVDMDINTRSYSDIGKKPYSFFVDFVLDEINNSNQNNDFSFIVNNTKIECNVIVASLISPAIESNLYADATMSSFTFDLQLELFEKLFEILYFLVTSKTEKVQFSINKIEEKTIEYLKQFIENPKSDKYISDKFDLFGKNIQNIEKETQKEKISEFVIFLKFIISLGNNSIAENLVKIFLCQSENRIEDDQILYKNIDYKLSLSNEYSIDIDYSNETDYIVHNFEQLFSCISEFDEIDEIHWKIITLRLSLPCLLNEKTNQLVKISEHDSSSSDNSSDDDTDGNNNNIDNDTDGNNNNNDTNNVASDHQFSYDSYDFIDHYDWTMSYDSSLDEDYLNAEFYEDQFNKKNKRQRNEEKRSKRKK